ncbi:MAG: substrate-binding domain-containing protein [Anaerolineales bacterium]
MVRPLTRLTGVLLLVPCLATACSAATPTAPPDFPDVAVSSGLDEPVANWMISYREEIGAPEFDLLPLPYSQAVDAATAGDVKLIISAADPEANWFITPLTSDGLAVIVHVDNPVLDLSLEDLRLLFSGGVSNWSELGGADLAVQPYVPYPGDDLRLRFEQAVMGGVRPSGAAYLVPHSRAARQAVSEDPAGVGFIPATMVDDSVRAVRIEGVLPGPSTIADGRYPIRLPIVATAPEEPMAAIRDWLVWLQEPGRLPEP